MESNVFSQEFINYTNIDGLPTNYVYGVIEDEDGYIWAYTENGICKFDGIEWKILNEDNGLPSNDVWQMEIDHFGRIWMANSELIACRLEGDSIISYPYHKNKLISNTSSLFMYSSQLTPTATGNLTKFEIDQDFLNKVVPDDSPSKLRIEHSLHSTWVLNEEQLHYKINDQEFSINAPPFDWLTCLTVLWELDGMLNFLVWSNQGLYILNAGSNSFREIKIPDSICLYSHQLFYKSGEKLVLQGGKGFGLIDKYGRVEEIILPPKEFQDKYLHRLFIDSRNNYWIGTKSNGLILITEAMRKSKKINAGAKENHFKKVFKFQDQVYAASAKGVIYKIENAGLSKLFSPNVDFIQVYDLNDSTKILSFAYNLITMNKKEEFLSIQDFIRSEKNSNQKMDLPPFKNCKTFYFDQANQKYFTSNFEYSYCYDFKTGIKDSLVYESFFSHFFNANNGMEIFGVSGREITNLNVLAEPELVVESPGVITAIEAIGEDVFLIGTQNNGLFEYSHSETSFKKILDLSLVREIIIDNEDAFVVHNAGITEFNIKDQNLNYTYNFKDGLTDFGILDAVVYENEIFVASTKGIYVIDRTAPKYNKNENVPFISEISSDDRTFSNQDIVNLNPEEDNVYFKFGNLDYCSAFYQRFEYRLLPVNEKWTETVNPFASFPGLKGGDYKLELRTKDIYGEIQYMKLPLSFSKSFYIWERQWFWISTSLLLAFVVYYATHKIIKNRQIKQRKEKDSITKLRSLQLESLRSQMNPHFVFNSLGSIQYYIQTYQVDEADEYLGMFATLMRRFLNSAIENLITIDEEVSLLNEYTRLEMMRFEDQFTTHIEVDTSIDLHFDEIPSMIIQPFIENAINHGLQLRKDKLGELKIQFVKNEFIECTISDNGIGINKSKSEKSSTHKSRGMENVMNRLKLLEESNLFKTQVEISTISDGEKFPGTQIKLKFQPLYHD